MEYNITSNNTLTIKMGIRPCATPSDIPEKDPYRSAIPLTCNVAVKDLPEGFALNTIPKVIMGHYVSDLKVDIQAVFRGGDKTTDPEKYKTLYDNMKAKYAEPVAYEDTETKARAKASKMSPEDMLSMAKGKALETISKGYPSKFASIAAKFVSEIMAAKDAEGVKAITLKYAKELEKKAQTK
jgi:hypothetical protein